VDPNSQNQFWSEWTFVVHDSGRLVPRKAVDLNIARWLCSGFGSAGAYRLTHTTDGWKIMVRIEGVPAHDPEYVKSVRKQFARDFVAKGWGPMAWSTTHARVLAGNIQDGSAAPQWVSIPTIKIEVDHGCVPPQVS
jgi:hypothetical protein